MRNPSIWAASLLLAMCGAAVAFGWGGSRSTPDDDGDQPLKASIRATYPGFVGQEVELAKSSARVMREYEAGDDRHRRDALVESRKNRAAAELKEEQEWQRLPMTPCGNFAHGTGPQLCIEHEGPATSPIGHPVTYRVRWRNLPSGAYIRVWSRNAAPAGQRWQYLGAYGAIAADALGGSRDGDRRIQWDGRSIYCAPADAPMMCDAGEVGRYVIRAAIMTGSDPFWPSWPQLNPVPVIRLAQSETQPFTLDGPPQPVSTPGRYRTYPLRREIVDAIKKALPSGGGGDWFVERRIDRLGPWKLGLLNYCARLALDEPLAGSLDICFSRYRRNANGIALSPGDISASGDARLANGVMSAKQATAKAAAYAFGLTGKRATYPAYPGEIDMAHTLYRDPRKYDGSYQSLRNAARDAGLTYVDINQPWPSFRGGRDGGWWLVQLGLSIQTIDGPRVKDWGRLALRVDQDGSVCQVKSTGRSESRDGRETYGACLPGSRRSV